MTGATVVVGITGGIAAYKAVGLVRRLVLDGHDVHVVATEAALRFVGLPTLEAISRNPVGTDLYDGVAEVRHVALGQRADAIVIAPATAHTLAALATGLAGDLLGTTVLASTAPLVLAPAMHTEMWQHPATVANVATLRERGATIVGPGVGQLTGSDAGPGRMSEPDEIADAVAAALAPQRDLAGRRVLITAGGTREPLDPVRFLGNRSSGKQGVALAQAAARRGAEVTLLAAHLEVPVPVGVRVESAGTADELAEAVAREAPGADILIMAAAVADYRPAAPSASKIKKDETGEALSLELVRNVDILAAAAARRRDGQLVVGFAAETERDREALLALGRSKLARKGCDALVLNTVGSAETFGEDRNSVIILDRAGRIVREASGEKSDVAHGVLDAILAL